MSPRMSTESTPSPGAALAATAIALLSAAGWSVTSVAGTEISRHLSAEASQRAQLVVATLGGIAASLAWDALFGGWIVAGAVVVTALWFGAPCRSLARVFLGLWPAYAVLSVALQFGLIILVPGFALAVLGLFVLDPVRRGEGRGIGLTVPGLFRALALLVLGGVWLVCWSAYAFGGAAFLLDAGPVVNLGAQFAYQVLWFGLCLAWCAILRGTSALV